MNIAFYIVLGFGVGYLIAFIVEKIIGKRKTRKYLEDARIEAEVYMKDKILQAKEKFLQLKEEHRKTIGERDKKIGEIEVRIHQKETVFNQKLKQVNIQKKEVNSATRQLLDSLDMIDQKEEDVLKAHKYQVRKLEEISGISAKKAREELIESLKVEARAEALSSLKDELDEARLNASKEARKIVIQSIQRVATEQAIDNSVSVFNIESDDVKGRIIGREGRNIRALENSTGVEIIVDDTPDAIILSCFDPVRREIARMSLHRLVTDGRIHPARIEEVVKKTKIKLNEELIDVGKRTCIDLNIHNLQSRRTY